MNANTRTVIRTWCFRLFVGLSGAAMLAQLLAVIFSFTPQSNYFRVGAIFPTLAILFAIPAIVCGTLDAFLRAKEATIPKAGSLAMLPAGIGFLISAIGLFTQSSSTLATISVFLALVAALYCILSAIKIPFGSTPRFFLCFGAVAGCASLTIYHYFDFAVEMNAPLKLSIQIAALCAMLFFVGEARAILSKAASPIYRAVTFWTVLSGSIASIPTIVAFLLKKTDRIDYLTSAIALLGITVSALLCLFQEKHIPESNPPSDTNI